MRPRAAPAVLARYTRWLADCAFVSLGCCAMIASFPDVATRSRTTVLARTLITVPVAGSGRSARKSSRTNDESEGGESDTVVPR
jgi:hypothetical protein